MLVEWIMAIIIGFGATFAQDATELREFAEIVKESAEREGHDPLVVLSIIAQESSFQAEPCRNRIRADRFVSREPEDRAEPREGVETLTWTCARASGTCSRDVWQIEVGERWITFDTCPAGENGYMQVLSGSRWGRSSTDIPGTEQDLSIDVNGERTEFVTDMPMPPEDEADTLHVYIDGERVPQGRIEITGAANFRLSEPPADGSVLTIAHGLSRRATLRREQMIDPRINVPLGCAEMSAHHADAPLRHQDHWWEWIGSYNTGTTTSIGSKQYARRVLARYVQFCGFDVPYEGDLVPLRNVYEPCAEAEEALENWRGDGDD